MKALVVANAFPYPLDDGYRVRLFHVLRGIVKAAPSILVCPAPTDPSLVRFLLQELEHAGHVEFVPSHGGIGRRVLSMVLGFASNEPYHVWDAHLSGLRRALRFALQRAKAESTSRPLVVATSPFVVPSIEQSGGKASIVDFHNVYSDLFDQYATRSASGLRGRYIGISAEKTRRLEVRCARAAAEVWTCSSDDANRIAAMAGDVNRVVVPNGAEVPATPIWERNLRGPLLFFGRLDYEPNVDAVRWLAAEIVPRLQRMQLDIPVEIVGAGASQDLIALVSSTPGMRYLGRVRSIAQVLRSASAVIVPLRIGGGTRLKVLEALGAGCPMIASTVAVEGINLEDGKHFLRADSADDFADRTSALLCDAPLASSLSINGHRLAKALYDWPAIEAQIQSRVLAVAQSNVSAT